MLCRPKRRYRATTNSNHSEARSNLPGDPSVADQWYDLTYGSSRALSGLACVLDGFNSVRSWAGPCPGLDATC